MGGDDAEATNLAPVPTDPTESAEVISAPTQLAYAWAADDSEDDKPAGWFTPARITALGVAAGLVVIAAAAAVTAIYLPGGDSAPSAQTPFAPPPEANHQAPTAGPAPATSTPPPAPTPPPLPALKGVDGKFIAEVRGYGVPVNDHDPQFTVNLAQATCATVRDKGPTQYPPGSSTLRHLTEGIMSLNHDWSYQQASRFTNSAVNYYCPEVRGPSKQDIAAMPPDQRFLAMLQDRLGFTTSDHGVSVINGAQQWCTWKAQGWGNDQIVDQSAASQISRDDMRKLVEIAIDVYCPQYR